MPSPATEPLSYGGIRHPLIGFLVHTPHHTSQCTIWEVGITRHWDSCLSPSLLKHLPPNMRGSSIRMNSFPRCSLFLIWNWSLANSGPNMLARFEPTSGCGLAFLSRGLSFTGCCSVAQLCLTLCDPHQLQHTRLPYPSPGHEKSGREKTSLCRPSSQRMTGGFFVPTEKGGHFWYRTLPVLALNIPSIVLLNTLAKRN